MTVAETRVEWIELMGLDEPGGGIYMRAHSYDPSGRQIPGQGVGWERPFGALSEVRRAYILPFVSSLVERAKALVKKFDEENGGREPTVQTIQLSRGLGETEYEINVKFYYGGAAEFAGQLLFSVYPDGGKLNYREALPVGIVQELRQALANVFAQADQMMWRFRYGGVK